MMSAAATPVQNPLMDRREVKAAATPSSAAFTTNANSPSVRMVIGSATTRRIGPRMALTRPKIAATMSKLPKPPLTCIRASSLSARANAPARTTHRISSRITHNLPREG